MVIAVGCLNKNSFQMRRGWTLLLLGFAVKMRMAKVTPKNSLPNLWFFIVMNFMVPCVKNDHPKQIQVYWEVEHHNPHESTQV